MMKANLVYPFALLLWHLLCASLIAQNNFPGDEEFIDVFQASVVKVDITPEKPAMLYRFYTRESTGVLDRIYHRIVVLDDGRTRFVLVSSDLCFISPSEYEIVAKRVENQLGIKPDHFWWTVTHTHASPEIGSYSMGILNNPGRFKDYKVDQQYTAFVEDKLIEGIEEALQKLSPASLGVNWGYSQANINRRARDIDGRISLGLNPDGETDRRIGLIRIDKDDGTPLVLIANYPIHGTVLGTGNTLISGDVPGIVSEYVEKMSGAPMLFINGAAGNLAPIYSNFPDSRSGHLGQFRVLLGNRILEANGMIKTTTNVVRLNIGKMILETPAKPGVKWPQDLSNYICTIPSGEKLVRLPISFMNINDDIAIWSAPVELFCEIANEIRNRSPFPFTFFYGYCNGNLGYLLTESEWDSGGYEFSVSP